VAVGLELKEVQVTLVALERVVDRLVFRATMRTSKSCPRGEGEVAFLVKGYKPRLVTKNDIDIDLLKCFNLESDKNFLESLSKLSY